MNSGPGPDPHLTMSELPADTSLPLEEVTVGGLFLRRAEENPDTTALIGTRYGSTEPVRLTYREAAEEVTRIATGLSRLAPPGSSVALWAPNVLEWPLIEYGAALAGVTLVALNPVLRPADLAYAVEHSGASVLLYTERSRDYDMAAVVAELAGSHPGLQTVPLTDRERWVAPEADETVLAAAPTDPGAPVMLQYTSGTTGRPKGVLLSHRALVNVARFTMTAVNAQPGAVAVNPLPMFHTAACVIGTLGPLWLGGTEILIEQFKPNAVLDVLRDENAEILFYVPAILGALLQTQRASDRPAPQLKIVMGGASNVSAAMITGAEETFGATVINLFGQTELAPVLSATRPDDAREDLLTTVGRPLPQVDCKVVDPQTGEVVPVGVDGEICARGYQQLLEYLHDPQATAATVDAQGYVHTGDLGRMDARGYLTVTGRLKELIIRGGENIAPVAIEEALLDHPLVQAASVVGLPDERWGEIVAAVIVPAEPDVADLAEALEAHLRERVAPYQIPARWFVSEGLPATPTGKIRKHAVVDQIGAQRLTEIGVAR